MLKRESPSIRKAIPLFYALYALALVVELLAEGLVRGANMARQRNDLCIDRIQNPARLRKNASSSSCAGVISSSKPR